MSKFKSGAMSTISIVAEQAKEKATYIEVSAMLTMGIVYVLLWIGEILEKYLKEIATNTKRIGNG
jgi:small neutral amino acid transporter SnatA (MarC family)